MRTTLVIALAALAAACSPQPAEKPEEIRLVRVETVGERDAQRRVEYAGEVRPRHETRLAFRVGGKMVARLVDVGAVVRPGQPVARLDPADLGLALSGAQAQVVALETERDLAAADLRRYEELRDKNFISGAEFDRRATALATAQARLDAARAQRSQAANQAAYATLVADGAGIVTAVEAEAGQVVSAGQTIARLARPGELEVAFAVPEAQRELLERAPEITVGLHARPGHAWKARLRELSPAADAATRTYAARATILAPGDAIELGMSARVAIAAARHTPRIEVPLAALHSTGDEAQVYVVGADATVRSRAVRTAGISGERVAIASGLEPGERIVAAGAQFLRHGQKVRVLEDSGLRAALR